MVHLFHAPKYIDKENHLYKPNHHFQGFMLIFGGVHEQWPRAKRSKRLGGLKPQIYLWTAVKIWHWNCFLGKLGIQGTGKFLITNKNTWELKPSQNSDSIMHISQNQLWYIMFWVSFFFGQFIGKLALCFIQVGELCILCNIFCISFCFLPKQPMFYWSFALFQPVSPPKKIPQSKWIGWLEDNRLSHQEPLNIMVIQGCLPNACIRAPKELL